MTDVRRGKRVGLLVPFTNTNLEPDFAMMAPPGLTVHVARMGGYDEDEIPGVEQMQGLGAAIPHEPLELLMGVRPDVVVYGCTSATLTHGPDFDRNLSRTIKEISGAHTVTAAGALIEALRALGVRRVAFASPYVPEINAMAMRYLVDCGFEISGQAEVGENLSNEGQGAMLPQDVFDLGLRAFRPDAEAIVLSCTDMRSTEIIAALEKQTGVPVITSNQAMMFGVLKAIGHHDAISGFGMLLAHGLRQGGCATDKVKG
ncbi:maleate cis-trans isomerase family protein [Roseobacter sp. S98]|uniref:maleate cis-trans isomerase family protein n=1 Tax=Roseobacter algicola (ex Choi et al. 2025) (nom. illeg.) TaxID=3092138 RepID=UPI003F50DA8D